MSKKQMIGGVLGIVACLAIAMMAPPADLVVAEGMDPQKLKDTFGKDIVFWGGGVDTQRVLPFGTPEEVREQVLQRLEIFSKDGGYICGTIHNIQANTPIENIIAMVDAIKEFNGDK